MESLSSFIAEQLKDPVARIHSLDELDSLDVSRFIRQHTHVEWADIGNGNVVPQQPNTFVFLISEELCRTDSQFLLNIK